jgi:hypothetical protein
VRFRKALGDALKGSFFLKKIEKDKVLGFQIKFDSSTQIQ